MTRFELHVSEREGEVQVRVMLPDGMTRALVLNDQGVEALTWLMRGLLPVPVYDQLGLQDLEAAGPYARTSASQAMQLVRRTYV